MPRLDKVRERVFLTADRMPLIAFAAASVRAVQANPHTILKPIAFFASPLLRCDQLCTHTVERDRTDVHATGHRWRGACDGFLHAKTVQNFGAAAAAPCRGSLMSRLSCSPTQSSWFLTQVQNMITTTHQLFVPYQDTHQSTARSWPSSRQFRAGRRQHHQLLIFWALHGCFAQPCLALCLQAAVYIACRF